MKTLRITLALFLSIFVCGCPATIRGPGNLRGGEIGHVESGILFPEIVNGFVRGLLRTYDSVGHDVSAGYNLVDTQNPIAITVYVYPAPKLLSFGSPANVVENTRRILMISDFNSMKAQIMKVYPVASILSEREIVLLFRGQSLYRRSLKFSPRERLVYRMLPVIAHVEIFAFGKWLIKFRVTHPIASQDKAKGLIDGFKKAFCKANEGAPNQRIQATK